MTGTPSAAAPHLDLDALADALAGQGGEQTRGHLSSCGSCSSRLAELEAAEARVVAALGALPDPPLPDGLAERIEAVLRAEPAPTAGAGASVTALPARAPRRRLLPAAAAAVLVLTGAGLGVSLVGGGADEQTSKAGGSTAGAPPLSSSGADYADPAAVTGVLPAVLAGGAGPGVSDSSAGTAADAAPPEAATSQDARATSQLPAPAAAEDPLARLRTPEGLADCLSAVLPPEEPDLQPRALDYAQFRGQPALAVLLPDPDPGKVSVYVVGPACAAADAAVLGFFRVDAP